jgi:arginyl-tRNA synthetase
MWDELMEGYRELLQEAVRRAQEAGDLPSLPPGDSLPSFVVEEPREKSHGDLAANVAMALAKRLRRAPQEIARALLPHVPTGKAHVARVEAKGGFLNAWLDDAWPAQALARVLQEGEAYGRWPRKDGPPILLEFVSANPTGPLNVVSARAAAVGDTLANLLDAAGYPVEREYYVNDAGEQARKLGLSLLVYVRQVARQHGAQVEVGAVPEGGYHGEYLVPLAQAFWKAYPEAAVPPADPREEEWARIAARFAMDRILKDVEASLRRFGVRFDRFVSEERDVRQPGRIGQVLRKLEERGRTFEQDGALWLRTQDLGDDKDRVLRKSEGGPEAYSYFAADIAYHAYKYERGYGLLLDLIGPDHHGYIPRMLAAVEALGYPRESLEMRVVQLVRLVRDGQPVRMSKRRGEFVTLDELLDEVGKDAARFFLLQRSMDSPLDFDLTLAREERDENPVFYVQYAHARIRSILRRASGETEGADLFLLRAPEEIALIRRLAQLPREIRLGAELREPHRLPRYALQLASEFHSFYNHCRVLGVDPDLSRARLALVQAVGIGLRAALGLMGVEAPERMEKLEQAQAPA